jgi:hypothetical protein
MLQCWQKRLLNNKPVVALEYTTAGSHSATLEAGTYILTLIGSGGGAVSTRDDISSPTIWHWARGGVGGTLQVKLNIPARTEISINVGAVGHGQFQVTTNATLTGTDGGGTSITGLDEVLIAGGGTGATLTVSGRTSTRTAGQIGSNTVSGHDIISIPINNTNTIVSTNGVNSNQATPTRTDTGQSNINWTEDTQKGASGGIGWANGVWNTNGWGKVGFVRIESA